MPPEPLEPVYLIWGEDRAMVDRALSRLIGRVVDEGGLPPDRFSAAETPADEVVAACQTLSFGGLRLVLVDEADAWRTSDAEPVIAYLASPSLDACLTLVSGQRPAPKLVDAVAGAGRVLQYGPDPTAKGEARRRWMTEHFAKEAERAGAGIDATVARRVVDRVVVDRTDANRGGINALELTRAAEKLALYAGGEPVDAEMVDALVPAHPDARIYELSDAVVAGDAARAFRLLEELTGGDDPQAPIQILFGLARHFRSLAGAQGVGLRPSQADVERATGLRGYPATKLTEQAGRLEPGAGAAAVARISELEVEMRVSEFARLGRGGDDGGRFVIELALADLLAIGRGSR